MRKENNLVRRLEAAEAMGGANEILNDKTCTLIQNKMSVLQFYTEGKTHSSLELISYTTQDLILRGCTLNSNSHLIIYDKTFQEKRIGNQTECALLDFVNKSLFKVQREEKTYENIKANNKVIKMYPFNSTTKKLTVIVETEFEKRVRVYTKGAIDVIEDYNSIIDQNNLLKK